MEEIAEEILINLTIKLSGNTFKIRVDAKSTLEEFKDILAVKISVPAENISLILNGRSLVHEESTLLELGVKDENTLFLTISRKDYIPTSVPLEPVGSSPEEKMMEQMMDNPMYASMFNNPDLLKGIMESNPQFKKILDSNPELRHVMNDPAAMNEMMRTMRNPTLRREMMRNTDRMMSNIESMPGGFNELRKMYKSIQEPMESAMDEMQAETQTTPSSTSSNSQNDGTANTSALPNPWAAASQTNNNSANMGMFGNMNSMLGGQNSNMFGGQNMAEMMNNPAVQSILNNPEMMNQIISSMSGGQNGASSGQNNMMSSMMNNPILMSQMSQMMGGMNNNNAGGSGQNNMFSSMMNNPALMSQLMGGMNNNTTNNAGQGQNMFSSMMNNPALMSQLMGGTSNNSGQTATQNPMAPNAFGNPLMFNPNLMSQLLGGMNNNTGSFGSPSPNNNANMFNPFFGSMNMPSPVQTNTSPLRNSSPTTQSQPSTSVNNNNNSQNNNTASTQPQTPNTDSSRYNIQIVQLNEMGFSDNVKNLQALEQTQGNVERAIELLFSTM
jgi:ubiquilin